MANKFVKTAQWMTGVGVIAAAVAFTPGWEGMDSVAKRDMIGTGHPITYCNGLTDEFGKVKVGQRFTKKQCDELLAEALPKYLAKINVCINVDMPDKTRAALLDAAWNTGPAAVCRSPMVAKMNAGDLRAGCYAFAGWYVRSDGKVREGLIDRRSGEDHGDPRLSEKGLCLQGLKEAKKITSPAENILTHLATPTSAPPIAEHVDVAATACTYGNTKCTIPQPKKITTDCGMPGTVACYVPHKRHLLKPKHVPVCTGFWWFRECK